MIKKYLLARKPIAVFIDTVVTVVKVMTRREYWAMLPGKKCELSEDAMVMSGLYVIKYKNGSQTGEAYWTEITLDVIGQWERTTGLAFSEALTASKLGMSVARKAWNAKDVVMLPIDATWPIETKGLPPLRCRKNLCTMPLNLNVPDFIANDWYIVPERPVKHRQHGDVNELRGGVLAGQMNTLMAASLMDRSAFKANPDVDVVGISNCVPEKMPKGAMTSTASSDALMDRSNSKELHDKIVRDILNLEHKLARNRRQDEPKLYVGKPPINDFADITSYICEHHNSSKHMLSDESKLADLTDNVSHSTVNDKTTLHVEALPHKRLATFVPLESQLGYPGKDATDNLTLDQRINERARIQRESGM